MAYTLGEATKATGISKTTLQRAVKSGKVSATKNALGVWEIDPAELHRVFPPAANRNSSESHLLDQTGTVNEIAVLRRELQLKDEERQRERAQFEGTIDDLRRRLDQSEEERRDKDRRLTALLTDQRAKAPDVIVTPPPPAADPAPAATSTSSVPVTPARSNAAPVAVKVRPVKKPPAKETGWFRRMIGGR